MSATSVSATESPAAARPRTARLHCLLAEFPTTEALIAACERTRTAGYTRWDAHSPFPVHGIDNAIGIKMTKLPIVVFCFGLMGFLTAVGLQWWVNATNFGDFKGVPTFLQGYNFQVSGKPFWSFPANIPVIFELTVLFSALCAGVGMLIANNLPLFYNPIFNSRRFQRVTSDAFFIRIDADDPKFHLQQTEAFLTSAGAIAVERVEETPPAPKDAQLPPIFVRAGIIATCVALVPLCLIVLARNNRSTAPRIHLIQDMDNQEKFKAQAGHALFADGRAMRPPVAGTIARGDLREDDHYFRGYKLTSERDPATNAPIPSFFTTFPKQVTVTEAFIRRGQNRFEISCAPCHGVNGAGAGMVNSRALELGGVWVQAANLHDDDRRSRPVGHIFNTISQGVRTMPAYEDRISEMDRWAIVAYVRALQKTDGAKLDELPEKERNELKNR